MAVYQLHEDRVALKAHVASMGLALAATAALTLFGVVSVLAVSPERIPILADTQPAASATSLPDFLRSLFPENILQAFLSPDFLYPVLTLAIFIGMALQAERANAKPAAALADALSRIFYHINSYFVEFLAVAAIFLAADSCLGLRAIPDLGVYRGILLLATTDTAIAVFGIVPLTLYFACGRRNPYRWLYAMAAPALAGLLSRDTVFSLGPLIKHAKESLGLHRRINAVSTPIAILAGRAGTAMVASVSFVVILRSYSSLGISFGQVLWVLGASLLLSLALGSAPGTGTLTAVVNLCALYGRGFESGYLIIKPVALPLIAMGACLDVVVAGSVSLMAGKILELQEDKEIRFYI